jgi:hypothetical protein
MARSRTLGYGEGSIYQEKTTGRWRGELRLGSTRRRISGWTRTEVVKKLDALRAEAGAGLPMGDDTRLGQWLDWYIDTVIADRHPNTQSSYRWAARHLEPLDGRRLRDLEVAEVEALLMSLAAGKPQRTKQSGRGGRTSLFGKSSLTRIRMVLGAALHEAERRNLVERTADSCIVTA